MNNDVFKRYAEIKAQINGLNAEMDELKPQIKRAIHDSKREEKNYETEYGLFSLRYVPQYEYSEECKQALEAYKEEMKQARELDINRGTAKEKKPRVDLAFKPS